jgi:hypothetical protein
VHSTERLANAGAAWCVAATAPGRTLTAMNTRFEIKITPAMREQLMRASEETGLSGADIARLGIRKMLQAEDVLAAVELESKKASGGQL